MKRGLIIIITIFVLFQLISCENEINNSINQYEEVLEDELKLLCVLTRHGDRTPLRYFKNSPSSWPEGAGELTPLGIKQHFLLGSEYRSRYIEEKKLINSSYHRSEFYAQSSGVFRTLMSADSFVMGLFPGGTGPKYNGEFSLPGGHQSVPIFSDSKSDDFLLYPHHCCDRAQKAKKDAKKDKEWKRLAKENEEIFNYLSDILGEKIELDSVSSVVTIANAERIHSRPTIPEIAHNQTLFSHLQTLQHSSLKMKFGSKEFGKLVASNLLREILNRTLEKHNGEEKKKPNFVLYSGHDTNILAVFSALDLIHSLEIPHYAEHISFEYFKPREENKSAYVMMKYNFNEVLIPGCPSVKCPLHAFSEVIKSKTLEEVNESVCVIKEENARTSGEL